MALTIGTATINGGKQTQQPIFFSTLSVAFDTSYPTGGEALDLSTVLPSHTILAVLPEHQGAYYFAWNAATEKLQAFQGTAGANQEVPNTTDLSALTAVKLTVISQ